MTFLINLRSHFFVKSSKALQQVGHTVGVCGDGVNDAVALKKEVIALVEFKHIVSANFKSKSVTWKFLDK